MCYENLKMNCRSSFGVLQFESLPLISNLVNFIFNPKATFRSVYRGIWGFILFTKNFRWEQHHRKIKILWIFNQIVTSQGRNLCSDHQRSLFVLDKYICNYNLFRSFSQNLNDVRVFKSKFVELFKTQVKKTRFLLILKRNADVIKNPNDCEQLGLFFHSTYPRLLIRQILWIYNFPNWSISTNNGILLVQIISNPIRQKQCTLTQ